MDKVLNGSAGAASSPFEAEVGRLAADFNTPGLAVEMLAKDKRHSAYIGRLATGSVRPVTDKTRFATVCMIKALISIKILMMAEKSEISLDGAIAEYLPELGKGPKAKGQLLKIRHLLSHTGGFRSFPTPEFLPKAHASWENCVTMLHDTEQQFEPGTVFNDEHLGHIILGQLIQRLKGKPFLDVVCEDVLAPLDIHPGNRTKDAELLDIYAFSHAWKRDETKWVPEPDSYREPDPAFGAISHLSMTAADLLRLGDALRANRPASGTPAISDRVKEQLFSQAVKVPRTINPMRITRWHAAGFGLGMITFRGGHRGCITTGRGQNSCVVFDKDRQSVVALAMNTANVLEREALLNTAFTKFAGDTSIVPEPKTLDIGFEEFLGPFTTRDIAGPYVGFQPDPVEIFASPRSFSLRIRGEELYQFEASPENRLVMRAKQPTAIGLFPDPVSGRPCLMMAMNAFKKAA